MINENEIKAKAIEEFMCQVKINQFYGKCSLIYFADNYIKQLRKSDEKDISND